MRWRSRAKESPTSRKVKMCAQNLNLDIDLGRKIKKFTPQKFLHDSDHGDVFLKISGMVLKRSSYFLITADFLELDF